MWISFNDGFKGSDFDKFVARKASFFQNLLPLTLTPLSSSGVVAHHKVKTHSCVIKKGITTWIEDHVNDDHFTTRFWYCFPAILQNIYAIFVAQCMQYPLNLYENGILPETNHMSELFADLDVHIIQGYSKKLKDIC